MFSKRGDKRGIVWNEIGGWIIALAALAILIVGYVLLKGAGINLVDKINALFRFGG